MSSKISKSLQWFTVRFDPDIEDRSFLDRAVEQTHDGLKVRVAVLSDRESRRHFGVHLSRRGVQAVWIECENRSDHPLRLDFYSVDADYYTPLEAAYICHFSVGKRLLSFGLLSWFFLPLLPLLPFKLVSARNANKRVNQLFKQESFHFGPILAGERRAGVVFTRLDEGNKNLDLAFVHEGKKTLFSFSVEVPGLSIRDTGEAPEPGDLREVSEDELNSWLQAFARCTSNKIGTREGDPLNLAVVGDRVTIRQCFGGRWDEAEAITLKTCFKTAKAFLFDAGYRYSPVSPLFVDGRMQDLALQKARASINERIHLRLWSTELSYRQQPVWIGQISRDIGVRFTPKTWNLTTHRIDPDVDEARDYVMDYLLEQRRVSGFGYVGGVEAAPEAAPRHNLTGDPYFTDGKRAVLLLAESKADPEYLDWERFEV
jgi:hypothetical protein